jgi:hypothetical protein
MKQQHVGEQLSIKSSPSSGCCVEFLEEHGCIEGWFCLMLPAYLSPSSVVVFVHGRGFML